MNKISVIMSAYNCATTIREAVKSVISQTYTNWELILCDDGSSDDTYAVVKEIKCTNQRIILIRNSKNRGLSYSLNRCLKHASGEYIARMDGDDICSPTRFEKEVNVLDKNPQIAIVSTGMEFFDSSGVWGVIHNPKVVRKKDFILGSPFCHAAAMIRKSALDGVGGYSIAKRCERVEDYDLWVRMYEAGYKGVNLYEALYQMRDDRNAYSRRKMKYRINEAYIKIKAIKSFKLPLIAYVAALRPILVGLMPEPVYNFFHKSRLNIKNDTTKKDFNNYMP